MSLDKRILKGVEHRKQYKGAKAEDPTCRNHGSCPYCYAARNYKNNKKAREAEEKKLEYELGYVPIKKKKKKKKEKHDGEITD